MMVERGTDMTSFSPFLISDGLLWQNSKAVPLGDIRTTTLSFGEFDLLYIWVLLSSLSRLSSEVKERALKNAHVRINFVTYQLLISFKTFFILFQPTPFTSPRISFNPLQTVPENQLLFNNQQVSSITLISVQ